VHLSRRLKGRIQKMIPRKDFSIPSQKKNLYKLTKERKTQKNYMQSQTSNHPPPPQKKLQETKKLPNLPNHHDPPTPTAPPPRQPLIQKPVHRRKPPQQILVPDIIDRDMQMLVAGQQRWVERRAQGGDDVGDVGGFEGLGGAEGEEAAVGWGGLVCGGGGRGGGGGTSRCRGFWRGGWG